MKKFLTILCVFAAITSCIARSNANLLKGNKNITSIEKSISSYSELSIVGLCSVIYEQKPNQKPYLRIEIDENLQQYVKAEVKNGVLSISLNGQNMQPTKFKAYTNSASLSNVKITGSGNVILKGEIKLPSLNISIAGSGDLTAEILECNDFNISIAGAGGAKVAGNASNSNVSINGSGNVDAINLNTKNTTCNISGSGSVKVYATEVLKGNINGSGKISYRGNPKTHDTKVNGSGSISGV